MEHTDHLRHREHAKGHNDVAQQAGSHVEDEEDGLDGRDVLGSAKRLQQVN